MKLKTLLLTAACVAGIAGAADAQTTRVAYVDIDRVTEKSDKINSAMGNVKNRVEDIQKEIEEKRKRGLELETEIKKGDGIVAESELKKKREEASKLKAELDDLQIEGRREMQKLDTTLFEPMVKTIVLAIQDVAKEQNIDLVVRGEAVIYGADSADITDAVIKKLNGPEYSDLKSRGKSSEDSESTASSKESEAASKKSSSSKDDGKTTSEEQTTKASATEGGGSLGKSIIPSVPLVKRPVDRQSE